MKIHQKTQKDVCFLLLSECLSEKKADKARPFESSLSVLLPGEELFKRLEAAEARRNAAPSGALVALLRLAAEQVPSVLFASPTSPKVGKSGKVGKLGRFGNVLDNYVRMRLL